jgi:hypothetical protein
MSTPVTYQILGPGIQQDTANDIDEALKKGSRMLPIPIFQNANLRRRLEEGKRAIWGYGFDECWVIPSTDPIFNAHPPMRDCGCAECAPSFQD